MSSSTIPEPERVDLADVLGHTFGAIIQPHPGIPQGELWAGPVGADAMQAFGPGTTAGGRAEAGWFMVGRIADGGPTLIPNESEPR
ncbi:hypothetical protein [Mycolicibacterium sp. F2034L]|uniref:hypothetical protein n=1 Tax=Mycolicibacterium sp. F2034L TaxID=2926422 RepID=UPI001FF4AACB|nr:hypothetical protein [Mycolicibacterium sp. F2034L]MCK0174790.1 hypothetical protein [Mycolicibacterium sp. F2034L]